MRGLASVGLAACIGAATGAAQAGCTRSIEVPMAPIGLSVTFEGERAGGIYPSLLRELSASAGCDFQLQRVPRARLQKMFEGGQADLLLPASASPSRDRDGEFVPLIQSRASLLMLTPVVQQRTAPRSMAELLGQPDFKLAVVRGFSFGPAYDSAVTILRAQKRLVEETDATGIARALRQGLAQGTVMAASIFIGTLLQESELAPLLKQVRIEPLEELGWSDSGVYLSRHTLTEADRRQLRQAFAQMAKAGRVWQLFNDSHPPGSVGNSIRPLP